MVYLCPVDTKGTVLLLEFWGCDSKALRDGVEMSKVMRRACRRMGTDIVHMAFRRLDCGVAGFVTGYTGHVAVRAWRERGYAMVDIYSCDFAGDPRDAIEALKSGLGATRFSITEVNRGGDPVDVPMVMLHGEPEGGMLPPEADHGM